MAFPIGWNTNVAEGILGPRLKDNYLQTNAFFAGTTAPTFEANCKLWTELAGANLPQAAATPYDPMKPTMPNPPPILLYSRHIWVKNDGAGIIQVTFHGTDAVPNLADELYPGEARWFKDRIEAGIALRTKPASVASAFRVVAW